MQELKLADDLFESLDAGHKVNTIRYGKRDVVPGPLLLRATNNHNVTRVVEVTNVTVVLTGDITDEKAQAYGYCDKWELIEVMRLYYPTIDDEHDDLTVIEFHPVGDKL